MKRIIQALISGILFFVAADIAIAWPIGILLWAFVLGDAHENIWRILPLVFCAASAGLAVTFVALDLANKTTRRSRMARLVFSVGVCLLALGMRIQAEASRVKGWNPDEAALAVASSCYPGLKDSMVLHEDSRSDIPVFGRGPNIVYTISSGTEPICRVAVCRRYWLWWTCGMYETLKKRGKPTQ